MNRREWLKNMSALAVGAVAAPSLLTVLDVYAASKKAGIAPGFFQPAQLEVISAVADIIIPRTDTPGAIDAGVPRFIDQMFKDVYTPAEQQRFLHGLAAFDQEGGKAFLKLDDAQRKARVVELQGKALAKLAATAKATKVTTTDDATRADTLPPAAYFVHTTKSLTMLGFFTSQPGCTQVLQYLPIPGAYHGDLPLSQAGNGKTWAT